MLETAVLHSSARREGADQKSATHLSADSGDEPEALCTWLYFSHPLRTLSIPRPQAEVDGRAEELKHERVKLDWTVINDLARSFQEVFVS